MAKINNFDDAMGDFENRFNLPDMVAIEKRLKDKHHAMQVSSDVINLFVPNIVKTFINLFGGSENDINGYKAPSDSDTPFRPSGPKAPSRKL